VFLHQIHCALTAKGLRFVVCWHFATVRNHDIDFGLVAGSRLYIFHLAYNIHTVHDMTKDHVLSIQMRSSAARNEKLRAVGIGASYGEK
jgi:hypothetical protein